MDTLPIAASKVGRPTKLDAPRAAQIISLIRAGNTLTTAARASGISYKTLKEWMARGRSAADGVSPYRAFRAEVQKARAEGEAAHVANIARAASKGSWQASAWYLERSNPRRWGRIDRLKAEVSAKAEQRPHSSPEAQQRMLDDPRVADLVCELASLMAQPK